MNLLVYASAAGRPHHARAKAFLEQCRTSPDLLPRLADADGLLAHGHAPRDRFWELYRECSRDVIVRGKLVPDAHLATSLRQHGVRILYSNDRDFRKFDFLDVRNPLEEPRR